MKPVIQKGSLAGKEITYAYTTVHGRIIYKVFAQGIGFGPGFSLRRTLFGWKWNAWSHENRALMYLVVKGFNFRKKIALGNASEEAVKIWEDWESYYENHTGRQVIAP